MRGRSGARTVVGYPRQEGETTAELLSRTPPSAPPKWPLALGLAVGLYPLLFPFAVWATVAYWRRPRGAQGWRVASAVVLLAELANVAGFLAYGYGRHFGVG